MPSIIEYNSLTWDLGLRTRVAKEIMMTQRFILGMLTSTIDSNVTILLSIRVPHNPSHDATNAL